MAKNGINFLRDPNARQKFFPKRDTTTFKKVSFTRYNKVTFGSIKNGLGAIKTNIAQVIANPSIEAIKKGLLRKNSIKPLADIYKWSNSANKALLFSGIALYADETTSSHSFRTLMALNRNEKLVTPLRI